MQESEILNLWKIYNKKLEENLVLNKKMRKILPV